MATLHPNVKDLTGKKFGRWTVLSYAGKASWNCLCECGNARDVPGEGESEGIGLGVADE
jgi:hypothetical protein